MKKTILTGFVSELALSACALACLIVAAVFGKAALIVSSAVVMLALLYIAGGFYAEHLKPGCSYFDWVFWFCNVFCVEWTWNIFCKTWTWEIFCKKWTWQIFLKQWIWQTFCVSWVWQTFCKKWVWQSFCIGVVYNLFHKDKQNEENT